MNKFGNRSILVRRFLMKLLQLWQRKVRTTVYVTLPKLLDREDCMF